MKNLFLSFFILFSICSYSQSVKFAEKDNYSRITTNEISESNQLKLINTEGEIIEFTVSASVHGFTEDSFSNSAFVTSSQKILMMNIVLPDTKIYFENIKVKLPNDSVIKLPSYVLIKDGVNADLFRDETKDYQFNIYNLLKHKRIYAFPLLNSNDSTTYKVLSFKISSQQPDFYYEFFSNSNTLTPEMINFAKFATNDFWITNIIASKTNGEDTLTLKSMEIETDIDLLIRNKINLLQLTEIDFISHLSDLSVKSFKLHKSGDFENENDYYLISNRK